MEEKEEDGGRRTKSMMRRVNGEEGRWREEDEKYDEKSKWGRRRMDGCGRRV